MKEQIRQIIDRIELTCLDKPFIIRLDQDQKGGDRLFVQIMYISRCVSTGKPEQWKGRKYYLSDHMTPDEVVKTVYTAFEQAVKHEVMEGFKVDGKILFNPHINFEEILKISNRTVKRSETKLNEIA